VKGIDYAFNPHPAIASIKAGGFGFVCRYMSPLPVNDANGKNLLPAECAALLAAGLGVVDVEESDAARMQGGHPAGAADAQHGDAVTKALGMPGIPVYFACDWDAAPADQAAINAYLDGAASVIGHARTGIYGGFWPLSRALDAGKAAYAWQTSAWSGGQWDPRAHIRQSGSAVIGGTVVDLDEAVKADFGQWPRPVPAPADLPAPGLLSDTPYCLVNLGWGAVPGATEYHYAIIDSAGKVVADVKTPGTHAGAVRLPHPGAYQWRVSVSQPRGLWSEWRPFTV